MLVFWVCFSQNEYCSEFLQLNWLVSFLNGYSPKTAAALAVFAAEVGTPDGALSTAIAQAKEHAAANPVAS